MANSGTSVRFASEPPAATMGRYAPFARLGTGGMAEVFLAVARGPLGFSKLAVIKRMRDSDDPSQLAMFLDEARLAARLHHPNVVDTYEVDGADGTFFMAMEYLEGQSLQGLMKAAATKNILLDDRVIAFICAQALGGLHYAHELADFDGTSLGVVHRDVSPHNVFVTYDGGVKILDFGIAKASLNSTQTEAGVVKGKVRYMAPEQLSSGPIDRRADVFSAGVILWELLARRPLFQGDSPVVLSSVLHSTIPNVRSVRHDVPADLDAIVAKALRRDVDARYPTAEAMRADLDRYLDGGAGDAQATLATVMQELFAARRDEIRARIKAYMVKVPADDEANPTARFAKPRDLPTLLDDAGGSSSGAGRGVAAAASSAADTRTAPGKGRGGGVWATGRLLPLFGAGALLLLVAIALSHFRSPFAREATQAKVPVEADAVASKGPTAATVYLESSPSGALVERNGRPLDRTPATITLDPGAQTLTLSLEGFEVETVELNAVAGEVTKRAFTLRQKGRPIVPPPSAAPARGSPSPPARAKAKSTPASLAAPPAQKAVATPPEKVRIRVLDDTP